MMDHVRDPYRHWGCRCNDRITWNSQRALLIQNELIQIVVLVDQGAEIVQFLYKPQDVDFLWHGPNALRSPQHVVPAGVTPVTSFFDHWSGGWFEVVPNGGPACLYKGAELGSFAETINVPWEYQITDDRPDQVAVSLWVRTYRTPFLLQKTLLLKSGIPALFIEERLTNTGKETMDFMWGHHPVVGRPFLDEGCRISAPACNVEVFYDEDGPDHRMGLHQRGAWPIIKDRNGAPLDLRVIPPESGGTMDNCYLRDLTQGWISIQNPARRLGFGLAWDPDVFRFVWLWQALGGGIGYPWYGRTYSVGLEPWTSYPCSGLQSAVDNGTAAKLEPGQTVATWLTAVAFTDRDDVAGIARDGTVR